MSICILEASAAELGIIAPGSETQSANPKMIQISLDYLP